MSLLNEFTRVTRRSPCPVCGKPNWCLVRYGAGSTAEAALCKRTHSEREWGEAGFFHALDGTSFPRRRRPAVRLQPGLRFDAMADHFRMAVDPDRLHAFARDLGVSVASLTRLGIGFASTDDLRATGTRYATYAWTFPMTHRRGDVVGIRLRLGGGKKLAVKGSRSALFVPSELNGNGPLIVAEGESDTAALLTLGARAIGRPGARTCVADVVRFVLRSRERRVILMADQDATGREGAETLAEALGAKDVGTRIVVPPAKDVRAWLNEGATRAELQSLLMGGDTDGEVDRG